MNPTAKILVAGIGNPLRSDDGAGAYVCEKIEALQLAGVTTMVFHQLLPEMIEIFLQYDRVFLVDASVQPDPSSIQPPVSSLPSLSHSITPETLNELSLALYQRPLPLECIAVPGENFDPGEGLSPIARRGVEEVIDRLHAMIEGG